MNKISPFLLCTLLLLAPGPLWAHGGGTLQIVNAPVGDCLVSVWSAPPSAKVGDPIHITVGAAQAEDGETVLDATVLVTVLSENGDVHIADVPATTEQSVNKLFYEADLPSLPAGPHQFEVAVDCRGVVDVLSFEWNIRPSTNPLFIAIPLVLGLLWLMIVGGRAWRKREAAVTPVRKGRPGGK